MFAGKFRPKVALDHLVFNDLAISLLITFKVGNVSLPYFTSHIFLVLFAHFNLRDWLF